MIIGSSMGGYFAHAIGTTLGTPVIMFNPALHSRSFNPYGVVNGEKPIDGVCVLGMNDDVIDPIKTYNMLKDAENLAIIPIQGAGHRTSFADFVDVIEKVVPAEVE
jgi:hypothetical protein